MIEFKSRSNFFILVYTPYRQCNPLLKSFENRLVFSIIIQNSNTNKSSLETKTNNFTKLNKSENVPNLDFIKY